MQDQICSLSKENENILLSLIIPVLNEEATIPIFLKKSIIYSIILNILRWKSFSLMMAAVTTL